MIIYLKEKFDMLISYKNRGEFSFLLLFFGLLGSQKINIVGQIYAIEIFSIIYVIFKFRHLSFDNDLKKLLFFIIFHQFVVCISDFLNNNDLSNFLKGFFSFPLFFLTIFCLTKIFYYDYRKYLIFFIGFLIGESFINNFLNENNIFFFSNIWKWGAGFGIINLLFLIDDYKGNQFNLKFSFIFIFIIIIISLYYGARALPLVIIIASILFYSNKKFSYLKNFNSATKYFVLSLIFFICIFLTGFIPSKLNSIKYFDEMNQKNLRQNKGSYGVVVAARGEWISIYHAFKDKPYIGHGSYPADKNYYYSQKIANFLYDMNYIDTLPNVKLLSETRQRAFNINYQQIPTHSFFGYHLVSYGILGILIMLYLNYLISKYFIKYSSELNFFYYMNYISFLYNFYFSPWGATHRVLLILFISALILKSYEIEKKVKTNTQASN